MISISEINGISKQGVRKNNEDYIKFYVDKNQSNYSRVVILCDGMGGHGHGEIASKMVAESVFSTLTNIDRDFSVDDLQLALDKALIALNKADVYDDVKKMGTTLVVAIVNNNEVLVGHVGDSRCYLFDDDGIIKFRTKDHSKVAEAVEAEILTEEEAINSEYKNILTRCVIAGKTEVKIEVDRLDIKDKDRLLLCSDGVIDAIRDEELSEILVNRNINDALALIDSKCQMKSKDNYSVIIADLKNDSLDNQTGLVSSDEIAIPTKEDEVSSETYEKDYKQKIDELYKKLNYLNETHKRTIRNYSISWCLVGFVFAFLLCGVFSYFVLKRVCEESKVEREAFYKYEYCISKMVSKMCTQKSKNDTVVLKREIETQYELIKRYYNKEIWKTKTKVNVKK